MVAGTGTFPSTTLPSFSNVSGTVSNSTIAAVSGRTTNALDEILKATPHALVALLSNLPAIDGNFQIYRSHDSFCSLSSSDHFISFYSLI